LNDPPHLTSTSGDAVDEVFDQVCQESRRIVRILRRGQRELVLAIAELGPLERNEGLLDVRLVTTTLVKEHIDATLDGLFRHRCICTRRAVPLEQRVLVEDHQTSNYVGRDVNTGERREGREEAVGVHVKELSVDKGDDMVYKETTPESVSKLCGRGQPAHMVRTMH
jgi:hypothetical protein